MIAVAARSADPAAMSAAMRVRVPHTGWLHTPAGPTRRPLPKRRAGELAALCTVCVHCAANSLEGGDRPAGGVTAVAASEPEGRRAAGSRGRGSCWPSGTQGPQASACH